MSCCTTRNIGAKPDVLLIKRKITDAGNVSCTTSGLEAARPCAAHSPREDQHTSLKAKANEIKSERAGGAAEYQVHLNMWSETMSIRLMPLRASRKYINTVNRESKVISQSRLLQISISLTHKSQ